MVSTRKCLQKSRLKSFGDLTINVFIPAAQVPENKITALKLFAFLFQHHEILQPILDNKDKSISSGDVDQSMRSQNHTDYFSQYGLSHNKLGAMIDMSKPKHKIPLDREPARHYNVLTGMLFT